MNRLKAMMNFDGLKIAQYSFIVIPIVIFLIIFGFTSTGFERVFESPVLTVQVLLVLSYPFCYLILKSIRNSMDERKMDQMIPLWILLICQISSLNMVCISLLVYGIVQTYGKQFLSLKDIKITKTNRSFIISMLPMIILYGLILFVRIRLGML